MSAAIIQTDVTPAFAPELSTISAGAWTDILAYVNELDLTQPGLAESAQVDRMAKIFLAAHMGTMVKRAGGASAGPLTSESVGGIRRSYGMISMITDSALGSTRYGQMYLDILGMSAARGPQVI